MGGVEKPRLRLELAHVLFLDIVGYSKLSTTEQSARIQLLREIVSHTVQVRAAEAAGALLRLPTGDGGALVFRSLEAPVLCAIEIATALQGHPELPVRMGIHSGPVNAVTDLGEQANIAGAGINLAQRVMDCGDAGHILVSKHAAEDLEHHDEWGPCLRDLGEVEIKHGDRLQIVNFYTDSVGNSAVPAKVQRAREAARARKSHTRFLLSAAAALLLLFAAGWYYWNSSSGHSTVHIADRSIAVLPFVNTSSDPSNEYFSDGLSEELISALSRLKALKVIGRTSSFQFKNTKEDSKTIGGKLGVFFLLEGSVRKSADRVRIAVELIKSADGASVWSQSYDKQLKDIFSVQSEIASTVAKELKVTLFGQETPTLANGATPSNESLDAYTARLKGDFYSARHTAEDLRKAIGFYEKAVALDPRYALAYANLSITASNLVYNFGNITSKEGQELAARARVAADTALQLDPNLSEAHLAKATFLRIIDLNFAAAEGESRRALELAPRSTGALLNLALLSAFSGNVEEALHLSEQEIALDPLRKGTQMNHALYLAAAGRLAEAETILVKAAASFPNTSATHSNLARVQIERGETAAAVESAKAEPDPFFRTYALAAAYYAHGDRREADAQLKKLIDSDSDDGGIQIASVYALRAEPEQMFSWLEHAWLTHDPGISELLLDPFLRKYKDDPRFIAFARKIGVLAKAATGP